MSKAKTNTNSPGRVYLSKGVSIDPQLYEVAIERAEELGLSWSAYVAGCLKRDIARGGEFVNVPFKPKSRKR